MNKKELIKKYEELFEKLYAFPVVTIGEVLGDLQQLDEPQPIKLKDVIARIEKFDLGTKAVWINEILNKLGSEYGTLKYKAGYEQGKVEGEWIRQQLKDADKICQELNKPTIPRFIADWIVQAKEDGYNIAGAINEAPKGEVDDWLELENVDIFAEAWVNGYHIEKEKRYFVKMKGMDKEFVVLKLDKIRDSWYLGNDTEYSYTKIAHTRKELEEAGFEEVFNSPLFEVEEVE